MLLQTHQQLVDTERNELSSKLAKLTEFINSDRFTKTDERYRERIKLILQEYIMQDYWDGLIYRITTFK
ncbi:crAss001_48 related protein [Gilliamella apicola]|uniref:crAss001_48 related protein n=1 Tax=Gilliamella apicola TaxID=1196095 RepID=UPI0039874B5A